MKIRPVILCGGSGSRLWPKSENYTAKQFIDFGGWTLLQKTLERIKDPVFDYPIISTNLSYLFLVRKYLNKNKIEKFKIILEPFKKNTAAAILSSALSREVAIDQPMIFFPADHLIEKINKFNSSIISNVKHLNEDNIFIFGHQVNDFMALDKQKIFALHHSAIQELHKQQTADKAEIATLKTKVATLETDVATLKQQVAQLLAT